MPGSPSPPDTLSLSHLLETRREELLQRWMKRVEGRLTPKGLTRSELRDSLPEFLEEMVADLRRQNPDAPVEPSPQVAAVAEKHGKQRYRLGSDINAVVWEYGVLRDVLLEFIQETGQPLPVAQWTVISHAITTGIAEAVSHFAAERENALRESEERLRSIINQASAYIYVKDAEGRYLLANRLWEKTLHGGKDVRGKTDHDVFPQKVADELRANDLQVLRSQAPIEAEEQDEERTYLSLKFPLLDVEGRPYAVCGISTDITARKRLEQEWLRALTVVEHGIACFVLDRDWRMVLVNRHQERLSRTRREETLGRNFWEVFPDIAHPDNPYWREYHRVMEQRVEVEFEAYYAPLDLWTMVSAHPVPEGIVVFFRDITEKRRIEAARDFFLEAGRVLSSTLDLSITLHSLAALVAERLADYCLVDLMGEDGKMRRVEAVSRDDALQPLLERIKAYPPMLSGGSPLAQSLARGEPIFAERFPPEWLDQATHNEDHRALLAAIAPKSVVFVPLIARGRRLGLINLGWTRQYATPIQRYVELTRGVADQAALAIDNAQLYQEAQESARAREELVAIVSHDLRNPLAAITLSTSTLLKREELSPAVAKGLSRIYAAADRGTRMISDLLDFTQARVGSLPLSPRPADFLELARQVVEEVQLAHPERDIHLRTDGEGHGAWDVDRVAQVITNLVGNAVQHSPQDTPVHVVARGQGEEVVLEVRNQGNPIPPDVLPRLFEPFRRGRSASAGRGSVGLGLYISQQVVRGHGGRIEVRSSVEEGTTFTVRMPRQSAARPSEPAR